MTETVSKIADLAFLLSDNPAMINTIPPQELLHALLPRTANKNKIMPKNSSFADTWMLKRGNPLHSVDAAVSLLNEIYPVNMLAVYVYPGEPVRASISVPLDGGFFGLDGEATTIPGAIIIALLEHVAEQKKDDIA